MNLVLLFIEDFIAKNRVRLTGRQMEHLSEVLRVKLGTEVVVGLCDAKMGTGKVAAISNDSIEMDVTLDSEPPAGLDVTLIMPLARPHIFKRALFFATCLGIKRIIVLNFARVEKSLWNSSALKEAAIKEQLILGLEQAKDTRMPTVMIKDRFKPFVEDELEALASGATKLVAHPGVSTPCPQNVKGPVVLVVGPEGGLVPFEVEALLSRGFQAIDLGARILRVDLALPFIISRTVSI